MMAEQAQREQQGIDGMDLAYKLIMALLATVAVIRAGQGATKAWQQVMLTIRPPRDEAEERGEEPS
jgi:hypothetical protein